MLINNKSKSSKKWLYLLVLPIATGLLFAFTDPIEMGRLEVADANSISPLQKSIESGDPVPSLFPLDKQYQEGVTWDYDQKAIHPITKKEVVHKGLDIRAPKGTAIYATADGVVLKADSFEDWGKLVVINHGELYTTHYAHLNEIKVEAGQTVKMGDVIGTVGTTGISTGDHLHYEVRKDGERVDPKDYF